MTDALPHGIVFNTHSIRSELNHDAHVEVEDVARLWRVYTTNKTTLEKDAGRRLENLFWRIWSNGRISCTIRGYTLASLFIQISEGAYTTEEWLRKEREIAGLKARAIPHGFHVDNSMPKSPSFQGPSRSNSSRLTPSGSSVRTQLPPSILKKPRPTSDEQLIGSPSKGAVTASYSGDSLYQPSDQSRSGSIRRKKTTFASNLTHSQEMEPGSLPRKIARPFPVRTLESSAELRPQSPPLKFRGPFDESPAESPTARPPNPTPSSVSKRPQFRSPFKQPQGQPQQTNSYTTEEGSLTANIRMSANITPADKRLLEEYLSNSAVTIDRNPHQEQPSSASLVEKDFRTRFVKKQVKEKEPYQHVSSLTNLIDGVQPEPKHHCQPSSSSPQKKSKSKSKSKHSPTPSSSSNTAAGNNTNSNNKPPSNAAATATAPDVPPPLVSRSSTSKSPSTQTRPVK
ncbi:uncharacterized protein GIQ15_06697 [Arthroderma uncinatum]|uniref:uncharacterized protein n=1 Tax=Arthroderma uncinatum TaxID=74035 RepID=UPI00144AAAC9|nr:uncharacterized protein GIQ15_06697 [Arthroderma uncinatum]KAF3479721.1 hypothetical protein GIQ15_06697 [Arthroderma uncinatum]